jgi:hypothetical protein
MKAKVTQVNADRLVGCDPESNRRRDGVRQSSEGTGRHAGAVYKLTLQIFRPTCHIIHCKMNCAIQPITQSKFDTALAQKLSLAEGARLTQRRLEAAEALLSALAGEEARWNVQLQGFDDKTRCLTGARPAMQQQLKVAADSPSTQWFILDLTTGDCVVASGFVAYLGPFNKEFRQNLLSTFRRDCVALNIPLTSNFDVPAFLVEDVELAAWFTQVVLCYRVALEHDKQHKCTRDLVQWEPH